MSFEYIQQVMSPKELKELYPMTSFGIETKRKRDAMIRDVFTGASDKFLVIIGPCSADREDAVIDYMSRLAKLSEQVSDQLILIPRIYTNKPRTTGEGYKGIIHQPDPEGEPDIHEGLVAVRKMHLRSINETGLTAADEMLYPENWPYLDDMLSYVAVGARSVEDQQHRLTVSGMDVPVGMKNPTSGDLSVMLNSCVAAQCAHRFLYRAYEVQTSGNPLSHTILRGAVNKHGQSIPNYHYEDLERLSAMYKERDLKNPAIIVDANHANSNKIFSEQPRIVKEVLHSRRVNEDLKHLVKGVMVESYLVEGCQKVWEHTYGKSITDACIGWEQTERLVHCIADYIAK
ncbi:MAG: 3-deoxy-7-phosphoheptulonate synthase [Lachnospiraceae bacterium]|nr:3-deoxy-7-phosphoheptulonate synthase [Lachnospiraceae bacterium]